MSIELMALVWKTPIGPATKRLVLLALADAANDEGVCWPKIETIARKANCSRTAVEDALRSLADDGIVSKDRTSRARYQSTLYTVNVEALQKATYQTPEIRVPDAQTPEIQGVDPRDSGVQTPGIRVQEPSLEPPEETKEDISLAPLAGDEPETQQLFDLGAPKPRQRETVADVDADFTDWYEAYPRHVGRGQAVRAYRTARKLKGVTAQLLLEAATSYALERAGQDKEFTPYPASWLNGQRWKDEPSARAARRDPSANTVSAFGPSSEPMSDEEALARLEELRRTVPPADARRVLGKQVHESPRSR